MRTGLNFALNYAAPEIVLAQEAGSRTLAVDPAADIWALGVTAYELLSGGRTFAPGTSTTEIRNMISGRLPLPWEVRALIRTKSFRSCGSTSTQFHTVLALSNNVQYCQGT